MKEETDKDKQQKKGGKQIRQKEERRDSKLITRETNKTNKRV